MNRKPSKTPEIPMPVTHKAEMLLLLNRSRAVINNEMALLTRWATDTRSIGRAAACEERIEEIFKRPHLRMEGLVQGAAALPPERVVHAPTPGHELLVRPNEASLAYRSALRVDDLTDKLFLDALDRAEVNSDNAVDDATTVVEDCTTDDPHGMMAMEAASLRTARRPGRPRAGAKDSKRSAKKRAKKASRKRARRGSPSGVAGAAQ